MRVNSTRSMYIRHGTGSSIRAARLETVSSAHSLDLHHDNTRQTHRAHNDGQPSDIPTMTAEHGRSLSPRSAPVESWRDLSPPAEDGAELAIATIESSATRMCSAHRDWPLVKRAAGMVLSSFFRTEVGTSTSRVEEAGNVVSIFHLGT